MIKLKLLRELNRLMNNPARQQRRLYLSHVLGLGIAQQSNKSRYDSAIKEYWEQICSVRRQGIRQLCPATESSSK